MQPLLNLSDDEMVARLHRGAFTYFETFYNPDNGLVADTSRTGSPCSIAVVGFALSSYPIGVEYGWITRAEAVSRSLAALRFFWQSPQNDSAFATGYKGFYYHFLDMHTGARVWQCELSMIDTALLMAGILTAGCYFDGEGDEGEIRSLADALYRRVDWQWAQNNGTTLAQGWKPECGFLHYGWEGYNEATLLYVLGFGSPTFPLSAAGYLAWTSTFQVENLLGLDVLYSGPLFTHLFSHAWIDFRGIRDAFMAEKDSDYFENTCQAIRVHREYCARNPHGFTGYDGDIWGVSAGEGPGDFDMREDTRDRRFFGYMSRGVPFGPDDGTLSPWAMLATLPFGSRPALRGTRKLLATYPQICTQDRFSSGFNPTFSKGGAPWLSEGWFGLDQGLLVLMIANAKSEFIWGLTRKCSYIQAGLRKVGFSGGWLGPCT